jgi:hypothetical protein
VQSVLNPALVIVESSAPEPWTPTHCQSACQWTTVWVEVGDTWHHPQLSQSLLLAGRSKPGLPVFAGVFCVVEFGTACHAFEILGNAWLTLRAAGACIHYCRCEHVVSRQLVMCSVMWLCHCTHLSTTSALSAGPVTVTVYTRVSAG